MHLTRVPSCGTELRSEAADLRASESHLVNPGSTGTSGEPSGSTTGAERDYRRWIVSPPVSEFVRTVNGSMVQSVLQLIRVGSLRVNTGTINTTSGDRTFQK